MSRFLHCTHEARGAGNATPIYGVTIPAGYRDWKLIAMTQLVTDKVDQFRALLGNEIAIKAYGDRTIPFPDGSIIAASHWTRAPSEDNSKILSTKFPGAKSFVVGLPVATFDPRLVQQLKA